LTPNIKPRLPVSGDIVARNKTEAKRRIADILAHDYPNHVPEDGRVSVWLKDCIQTERSRSFEFETILVPKGTKRRKYEE
jgi:hypothetical protein